MFVVKRNGTSERVLFDKITKRMQHLCKGLDSRYVDPVMITQRLVNEIHNGIETVQIDNLSAEMSAYMTTIHPDYATLAARILVSNLHKETCASFMENMSLCYDRNLVSTDFWQACNKHSQAIELAIDYDRDYEFTYFGLKTLLGSYLLRDKATKRPLERCQDMWMRVALGIHTTDITQALQTYEALSKGLFIHATPTLFNAGTKHPQMSSCFLMTMQADSIEGIYDTLKKCAIISKHAGGIGINVQDIRASGSYIHGTGGYSSGLIPMLRVFNATARYVDQGGNKRKGSFAVYFEPWHADIYELLDLRKNNGNEDLRARDLFLGLWICDLFMRRVESDADWTLFSPSDVPDLPSLWGEAFERQYTQYERSKPGKTIKAQHLWKAIVSTQIETGIPYVLFKDSCNRKSNQQHLGTIQCSNLCTEIIEYCSPKEIAVCNLASIALPGFVRDNTFDFDLFGQTVKQVTRNLNRIIDVNYYPLPETSVSNLRHRPIGIGVQGLADVFMMLHLPFDSEEAGVLNAHIFEALYYYALDESCHLASIYGTYESYHGSPVSQGILQFDMWDPKPDLALNWTGLRQRIATHGIRNSLLVAPMPTASTSQILGNNECFEPYTSNIYTRRVLAGEFTMVNKHLVKDLIDLGLWSTEIKDLIVARNGSVQGIDMIPAHIQAIYKTVWEIKQKVLLDMAIARAPFIDQSMSLNLFMEQPTQNKVSSMLFYAWKGGLKTGMYYLRTRAAADPIKFTLPLDTCTSCSA
jgi:ribonucleoside-diphosphate reductase subunit M1